MKPKDFEVGQHLGRNYGMFLKLYTISTRGNGEYFILWLGEDGKITNRIVDLNHYITYQIL